MSTEPSTADREESRSRGRIFARRVIWAGWVCVVLAAVFLYISKVVEPEQGESGYALWATYLMLARLCGLSSFAIGGIAIFNHRWVEGIAMLLLSFGLPVIAFVLHGTI